jgi:hypothetical protein
MSLLQKAKAVTNPKNGRVPTPVTREELELAIAFIRGEVSQRQVLTALGRTKQVVSYATGWAYSRVAAAYRQGWLTVKKP